MMTWGPEWRFCALVALFVSSCCGIDSQTALKQAMKHHQVGELDLAQEL
jgi:hypothetical protein